MALTKREDEVNIYEMYLRDIRKYGTIDDAQTRSYLKIYKEGNAKERKLAKERIVGSLQRFVMSIANQYATEGNLMDIINEGNIGLMTAIEEYNINSDVKFTTYATYWIRKTIMNYITLDEPMVTPKNAIKLATYVPKIRNEFVQANCRQPTNEEIQDILLDRYNLNFANKEDLSIYQSVSIDERYDEDEDGQEFIQCSAYTSRTAYCDVDEVINRNEAKETVKKLLAKLNDRDAYIVKCIYGIDCNCMPIGEVALEVGLTNERVRQIVINSIKKLGGNS